MVKYNLIIQSWVSSASHRVILRYNALTTYAVVMLVCHSSHPHRPFYSEKHETFRIKVSNIRNNNNGKWGFRTAVLQAVGKASHVSKYYEYACWAG